MKRDMDLIRRLLFRLENEPPGYVRINDTIEAAHIVMMGDAGFVKITAVHRTDSNGTVAAMVEGLTWSGHDLADAMRDDTIWKKAQDTILKPVGGVAFDVLLQWLKFKMQEKLGLPTAGN